MAIAFSLSLAFKDDGFGFRGVVRVVATWEVGWAANFFVVASGPDVTTYGDPFSFYNERGGGDFGTGESRPLGRVSAKDEPVMSLGGFWALAFFFVLFGFGGGDAVKAFAATKVATGLVAGGGEGEVSLLGRLDADGDAMVPLGGPFLDVASITSPHRCCCL